MYHFFEELERQGPGCDDETCRALDFVEGRQSKLNILDVGCGTGAQTFVLADKLDCSITAVDFLPDFLSVLEKRAQKRSLGRKIKVKEMSMFELDFEDESFDLIWSEGAIYIIGFKEGFEQWKKLLKPGGYIAVTELSWLTDSRPEEIENYWNSNYPGIDTVENKLKLIESAGYLPVESFIIPDYCWSKNYHEPILARADSYLKEREYCPEAVEFINAERVEAAMFERYKEYFGYAFYIAKRI